MKKLKFRRDDRGLTLLELLVAVAILAIITAPLLHTFITSAKTASKSAKLGNATLAAQNIQETLEATHLDTLVDDLNSGRASQLFGADSADLSLEAGTELKTGARDYSFTLRGVSVANSTFDAVVTLDADKYAVANTTEVTQYTPMDAVFSQPSTRYENPDWLAADSFANTAVSLSSDSSYATEDFLNLMTRTIDVTVSADETKNEINITTTYNYSCNFSYTLTSIGEDGVETSVPMTERMTASYTYDFFRGKITGADSGLVSVYFFFFPNYTEVASGTVYDDIITIYNRSDLQFSFFLIKQKYLLPDGTTLSDSLISAWEASYTSVVNQKESVNMRTPNACVYSNINQDISGFTSLTGTFSYRIFRGDVWYDSGNISGDLVATERQNRLYGVSISLYDPGETSGAPVFTLSSTSKLD